MIVIVMIVSVMISSVVISSVVIISVVIISAVIISVVISSVVIISVVRGSVTHSIDMINIVNFSKPASSMSGLMPRSICESPTSVIFCFFLESHPIYETIMSSE